MEKNFLLSKFNFFFSVTNLTLVNGLSCKGKILKILNLKNYLQMPKSQPMTIMTGGYVSIPFSFLPFSIEFRILPQPSSILLLTDANNKSLARIALDKKGLLVLTLFANMSEVEQLPQLGLNLILNFTKY